MNLIKNLKTVGLLFALCLLFTTNVRANSIEKNEVTKTIILSADSDIITDCLYSEDLGPGWDKFKKRWKEFWDGFLDGFNGGLGGQANTGDGINNQDLNYIKNFALSKIRTRDNAAELVHKVNKLILYPNSNTVSMREIADVFGNDARMMSILTDGNSDIFPIDKNDSNLKSFWGKLGRILGRIAAILLLQEING